MYFEYILHRDPGDPRHVENGILTMSEPWSPGAEATGNRDPAPSIVMWGAGGQSVVLHQLVFGQYQLRALFVDHDDQPRFGVPLIAGIERIASWIANNSNAEALRFAIAIGGLNGALRLEKHSLLKELGLIPQTLKHSTATVLSKEIGEGCQILAASVVGVDAKLGKSVVVNTSASIDHECQLGDGVHIAPGATIAGRVRIGECTFVGAGATIGPDVTIAPNCVIGAGAVVVKSIVRSGTYVGVPARRLPGR